MNKKGKIRNRILRVLTAAVMLATCVGFDVPWSLTVWAAKTGTVGTINWSFDNGVLTLSGSGEINKDSWYNRSKDVTESAVKEVIIGEGITAISAETFYLCGNLVSVSIPSSVTKIGEEAFSYCRKLETVTFSDASQLEEIGASAFNKCTALTTIQLPSSLTTMGEEAFYNSGLTSIKIPASLKVIPYRAFYNTDSLTTVTLENGVETIGNEVFSSSAGNSTLKTVNLPETLTSIGENAFNKCAALDTVTFSGSSKLATIGAYAFNNCKALTTIQLPSKLTTMGDHAFYGSGLTSITIPASLNNIPSYAFGNTTNLTTVTFETDGTNGVETIGEYAFRSAARLTNVTLPDTLKSIERYAFDGSGLTSITIPASVDTIGSSAFNGAGLTSVTFETDGTNGVNTIGEYAFYGTNLTSIILPETLTSLGAAFYVCDALETVEFTCENKPTTLESNAFYYSSIVEMKIPCNWGTTTDNWGLNTSGWNSNYTITRTSHVVSPTYTRKDDETHHIECSNCGTNSDEDHTWGEGVTTTSGCITTTSKTCSLCNATKDEVTGNHNLTKIEATTANCTTQAVGEHYKCSACNELFTDSAGTTSTTIAALTGSTDPDNHSFTYTADEDNDTITQGCENNGCGHSVEAKLIIDDTVDCTYNNGAEIKPAKISYSGATGWTGTAPAISYENNTEVGTAAAKMTVTTASGECAVSKEFQITAAHTHTFAVDWTTDDNYHWYAATCGHDVVDSKAAHTEDSGTVTLRPTETTEGTKTFKCSVCGDIMRTETIPSTGTEHVHDFGTEWKHDNINHWHECGCGEKSAEAPHTPSDWIVETPATVNSEGVKIKKCTVCDTELERAAIEKLTDTPDTPDIPGSGNVEEEVKDTAGTNSELVQDNTLINNTLTDEDKTEIENGSSFEIVLEVTDIEDSVPPADVTTASAVLNPDEQIGVYVDLSLFKIKDNNEADRTAIHETSAEIGITLTIPDSIYDDNRTYSIIRVHNGDAENLGGTYDKASRKLTFYTDKFSTYAIAYTASNVETDNNPTTPTTPSTPSVPSTPSIPTIPTTGGTTPVPPSKPAVTPAVTEATVKNEEEVLDDEPYVEDVSAEAGIYENDEEDNSIHYILISIFAAAGILIIAAKKRFGSLDKKNKK